MINEIIKVLELIISSVSSATSPERKRQRLAKTLLDIYHKLRNVCDRARHIVDLVAGDEKAPRVVAGQMLVDQQDDLRDLAQLLDEEPVKYLINLHLPEFRHFPIIVNAKIERLGFFLMALFFDPKSEELYEDSEKASWNTMNELETNDYGRFSTAESVLKGRRQKPLSDEEKALISSEVEFFRRHYNWFEGNDIPSLTEQEALVLLENSSDWWLLNAGKLARLDNYKDVESNTATRRSPKETPVRIFSTKQQLTEARETTNRLDELCEKLRKMLLEQFKVEELI